MRSSPGPVKPTRKNGHGIMFTLLWKGLDLKKKDWDFLERRPVPAIPDHLGWTCSKDWYKKTAMFSIAMLRANKMIRGNFSNNVISKLKAIAHPDKYEDCQLTPYDCNLLLTALGVKDEWYSDKW